MSKPLYNFMPYEDTPILNEPVIPGSDEPNVYGSVVRVRGELRIRVDGFTYPLWSIWEGRKLKRTTYDKADVAKYV